MKWSVKFCSYTLVKLSTLKNFWFVYLLKPELIFYLDHEAKIILVNSKSKFLYPIRQLFPEAKSLLNKEKKYISSWVPSFANKDISQDKVSQTSKTSLFDKCIFCLFDLTIRGDNLRTTTYIFYILVIQE